eukprot:6214139-Pleurochrysis_carterae.AAC.4
MLEGLAGYKTNVERAFSDENARRRYGTEWHCSRLVRPVTARVTLLQSRERRIELVRRFRVGPVDHAAPPHSGARLVEHLGPTHQAGVRLLDVEKLGGAGI